MTRTRPSETAHAHAHASAGARQRDRRRLALVLALVLAYAAVELLGGWLTNSLALLSDALHMVSDSAALGLSLLAALLAARPANARRTFGHSRVEILAALANGVALAAVALFIGVHAVERASSPREVAGEGLLAIATGGLAVNLIALFLLGHGHAHGGPSSLNVRGALLHVASDTLASVGVILAGAGIWLFGWLWLDPLVSLVVSLLVLWSAWQLIRDALDVLMEAVPAHLDLAEIQEALLAIEGVRGLHCIHVWTIGTDEVSLSSHLVVDAGLDRAPLLEQVRRRLDERFAIHHTTIQLEPTTATGCAERPGEATPDSDCPDAHCGPGGDGAETVRAG